MGTTGGRNGSPQRRGGCGPRLDKGNGGGETPCSRRRHSRRANAPATAGETAGCEARHMGAAQQERKADLVARDWFVHLGLIVN